MDPIDEYVHQFNKTNGGPRLWPGGRDVRVQALHSRQLNGQPGSVEFTIWTNIGTADLPIIAVGQITVDTIYITEAKGDARVLSNHIVRRLEGKLVHRLRMMEKPIHD